MISCDNLRFSFYFIFLFSFRIPLPLPYRTAKGNNSLPYGLGWFRSASLNVKKTKTLDIYLLLRVFPPPADWRRLPGELKIRVRKFRKQSKYVSE